MAGTMTAEKGWPKRGFVEVVSVGLWICGGWPVGAWWWLAVGLLQTKEKKIEEKKK